MIWLASYPKSGNTWLRFFLSHLTETEWDPEDLNSLRITNAASRNVFDRVAGIEASDLTHAQIDLLRPRIYEQVAAGFDRHHFLKTHDAWTHNAAGEPILSTAASAVYLVRNPLDVAVSFAHHQGIDVESVVRSMQDPAYMLCGQQALLPSMIPTRLLSWEGHVRSWLDDASVPVLMVRYEDMLARPLESFSKIVEFSGLEYGQAEIEAALAACTFQRLQEREKKTGFRERLPGSASFFRKGVAGSWREALTAAQVQQLITAHGGVMRRLGYLDAEDHPLF
jgi:hypothetical protein